MQALSDLLDSERDAFAALIIEPLVLGAGGMKMYSPAVLSEIAALCRQHDVFLIADEVMTGFGRTGTMFACEQAGVAPDLMCLSKGLTGGVLPMGVTLASSDIYENQGRLDKASHWYQLALEQNPESVADKAKLGRVRELQAVRRRAGHPRF